MPYKVVVDPRVYDDLHEIHHHIAEDNPGAADKLIDLIEQSIQSLSEMPDRARLRPDLRDGYRVMIVGSYLLFYRIVDNEVQITRALHASRDTARAFLGS